MARKTEHEIQILLEALARKGHPETLHNCPDGYKWYVRARSWSCPPFNHYEGRLIGPGGGQLALIRNPDRTFVERRMLELLDQHRNF